MPRPARMRTRSRPACRPLELDKYLHNANYALFCPSLFTPEPQKKELKGQKDKNIQQPVFAGRHRPNY